ncbi:hypothetical protein J6590_000094 [Homalodisca vitripennis]|nr:hypothetical protein J6590_000094 [Homalodisca vitripennis]
MKTPRTRHLDASTLNSALSWKVRRLNIVSAPDLSRQYSDRTSPSAVESSSYFYLPFVLNENIFGPTDLHTFIQLCGSEDVLIEYERPHKNKNFILLESLFKRLACQKYKATKLPGVRPIGECSECSERVAAWDWYRSCGDVLPGDSHMLTNHALVPQVCPNAVGTREHV